MASPVVVWCFPPYREVDCVWPPAWNFLCGRSLSANPSPTHARVPAFVNGTSTIFKNWAEVFRAENRNALNTTDQTMFIKAGGDPMIHYLHGWWQLEDGQALRITSPIPDCEGWNFQINKFVF